MTQFERSESTARLYEKAFQLPVGGMMRFEDFPDIPVRSFIGSVNAFRDRLVTEAGVVLISVRRVGYRRMTPEEIALGTKTHFRRIHGIAGRAHTKLRDGLANQKISPEIRAVVESDKFKLALIAANAGKPLVDTTFEVNIKEGAPVTAVLPKLE